MLRTATKKAALLCAISLAGAACKTSDKKKDGGGSEQSVSGMFDSEFKTKIATPQDIYNFTPPVNSRSDAVKKPQFGGLSLTDKPTTTEGVEGVALNCYNKSSKVIGKNWYFYAELTSAGNSVNVYNSEGVEGCAEMQVQLTDLDRSKTYEFYSSFYWQSEDKKVTIVYYEGQTKEFKPSDVDLTIRLEKKRIDQKVNVELEKTDKDTCLARDYLWTGTDCIDTPHGIVFTSSDYSDYYKEASAPQARAQKCLQVNATQAVQFTCTYRNNQEFVAKLHGVAKLRQLGLKKVTEAEWFTLEQSSGGIKTCLTVDYVNKSQGNASIKAAPCFKDTDVPNADQLFRLVQAKPGDEGARNSFLIYNEASGEGLCVSLPPLKGDRTKVSPLSDNAPAQMTKCPDNEDENVRLSQFIQFRTGNE